MPRVVQGKTESDEEFEILDVRGMARNGSGNWIDKYLGEITKASTAKQIAVGGLSGWIAGFVFTKVGRTAAASIGGSLLLLQLASHQGYIKVNWGKVNYEVKKAKQEFEKRASHKLPWILEEAEDFIKDNIFLASGFAGGFLIGMASS